ncbi:hypothetical protein NX029_26095 [Cytobacillus firmus]|nr:hypothetical protein [Cytobacillus firmus]
MKYIVKTPSAIFNGKRAGVHFSKGTAEFTDEKLVAVFKDFGYEVTEVKEAEVKQEAEKPKAKKATKKRGE